MSDLMQFGDATARVEKACRALANGEGIILIDDEHRENEGDFIFSATRFSIQDMAKIIRDCSGIVCLCLPEEKAQQLNLKPMVENNTSPFQTAFTVSIEARLGVTTGVSAHDRWVTIQAAIQEDAKPTDLRMPGHVFPLIARKGGVFERRGHTEGSIDLLKIAGLPPYAVLCELMNTDGTMKKLPQLIEYAKHNHLTIVSVEDIHAYRKVHHRGLSL